ncbi:MAG: COP23 domain-containing protein [Dolichospermum sp.]
MKYQLKTAMIVGSLALSSIFAFGSTVQAFPKVDNTIDDSADSDVDLSEEAYTGTQFTCVPDGNGNVATVGQRPGGDPIPVIMWTSDSSKYFGQKISPQSRCQIVTERFNQAVTNSGGSLQDVVLTSGKVGDKTVICVLSIKETGCDGGNTLFTLNPKNAKRPNQVLAQIAQISRQGSSAGVIRETRGRVQVKLSDLLKGKSGARIKPATRGL